MLIMLLVREAKETPAEYLTIELLLSGEADFPAMAVATAVAMTAASCLLSGVMGPGFQFKPVTGHVLLFQDASEFLL